MLFTELSRRSAVLRLLSAWPVANALARQEGPEQPTFSTDVKVVNVFATVRDSKGQIVRDLAKDDFLLSEDDRPQTIRYFARQTDLPLTLGLLVDTSGSERRMIGTERDASFKFLEQVLRPEKDKAFLIHFDRDVELLQDLTSSRERLEKALDLLGSSNDAQAQQSSGNGGGGWPGGGGGGGYGRHGGYGRGSGGHHGGGTALFDAVYLASNDVLKGQSGRKALILLTDGEDNGSKVSLEESVTTTQRADSLAYSVRIADESQAFGSGFGSPGGYGRHGGGGPMGRGPGTQRPDGKKILQQISRETGGSYFEVSKKKTVSDIYGQIEDELRNQYSIGYAPDRPLSQGGYRRVKLTVRQKGMMVQSREGYYAS